MKNQFELLYYQTADSRVPFAEWLEGLDNSVARRIEQYLDRLAAGNWGKIRVVGSGVIETKTRIFSGQDF